LVDDYVFAVVMAVNCPICWYLCGIDVQDNYRILFGLLAFLFGLKKVRQPADLTVGGIHNIDEDLA
jgi:hypothetical protein